MARTKALCLAFCALASTASAQVPVTDPAVLARVTLGVLLSQDELRKAKETFDILTKMAGKGPDQSRYKTPTIAASRHQAGKYLYGGQLLHGLNAGDRVGELLMASSYPLAPSVAAVNRLTPDQQRRAVAQLASIDIADSVGQRALHQVALARGFDAETARAIENLDADVMNPRTALHYMTAVVDKLSGGALIGRRQQAVSNQLTSHIVEQLLVETKRRRDAETEVINMELSRILYGRESARMLTKGMTRDLTTWRLP
jgi:hypothetical protein